LRTKEENTFIFAYITTGNYLIMQKFKVVSNDASNCIQLIKTFKENVKSIPKNSRRCMITKNQYVECLDIDENQMYVVRLYDSNLNFLKQFELENNNAPLERVKDIYHETVWLKNEISVFIYFTDISDNNARPLLVLKKLVVNNGEYNLENVTSYLTKDIVMKNIPYKMSDTENSLAIFNEYYFALSSFTDDKKYTYAKLEDVLGYKVESYHNSLLRTNVANTFIFAYITTGNYLIMQKFKVVSNDASNCIQLIKTSKETVQSFPKNSRRCMITKKQYVECLDMDENQMYVVRVYDS
jgi:hypothetical protein